MPWTSKPIRRLALAVAALGSAAAVVGTAGFALFTSAATQETDTFAAGTVIVGTKGFTCDIPVLEPGDSTQGYPDGLGAQDMPPCVYQVQYTGSLPAWVALDASIVTTPGNDPVACAGGQLYASQARPNSCQPLYNPGDPNGLNVVVCGLQPQALTSQQTIANACVDEGSPVGFGIGPDQTLTYPTSYLFNAKEAGAVDVCTGLPSQPPSCGPNEVGAVVNGWTYDFVVQFFLPYTAGNAYQGGTAQVQLQVHATQASNNPLSLSCPAVYDPNNGGVTPPVWTPTGGYQTLGRVYFFYSPPDQPANGWGTSASRPSCPSLTAFYHPYS
jgi:hypothetical protein